jgi:hypothetical protein
VCGKIDRTAIRLDLYDSAGRDALSGAMHEDFADTLARYEQNRAGVKFARQLYRMSHGNRLYRV